MAITVINDKGRIQIPKKIREELRLKSGEEHEVRTEGKKIMLLPLISPEEFIKRIEGKIKSIWKMYGKKQNILGEAP